MLDPVRNGGNVIKTTTLVPAEEPEIPASVPVANMTVTAGDASPARAAGDGELVPPPSKAPRKPQQRRAKNTTAAAPADAGAHTAVQPTDAQFLALGRATHKALQIGQSLPYYIESLREEIAAYDQLYGPTKS